MGCPANSIRYNGTLCACPPGQLLNRTANSCEIFGASSEILTDNGVEYALSFPETILSFDAIRKFTQSEAVFLEATLVMLLSWLVFCFFLRLMKLGDGRNLWFSIRWWISRLDICFSTRHWLDDQKVVKKRKTELGGTFSIASWMLFIGLFAALLYQIINKRSIEVHNVRATNAPDLASFINDMEFNVTTVSSMSCSNLRGLGTLVKGNPGFNDNEAVPLSNLMRYSCRNSSTGPIITFKCSHCRLMHDYMYISWQFVDLPGNPAVAVGFQFNLTSKNQANKKHVSFVSGLLKNGSTFDDRPVTFRGTDTNILKFNFFPRIYNNFHSLRLIQPLFHEFVPGSNYHDGAKLQASLIRSNDGLINTTLFINYLSAYVIEVDNENLLGPVSFLADLGGLYCISIVIFFYLLVQCEYIFKKLRNEDSIMRRIRNRRKAQDNWDKLRRYVMYTWGCSALDSDLNSIGAGSNWSNRMKPSVRTNNYKPCLASGSSRKRSLLSKLDTISLNKKVTLSGQKKNTPSDIHTEEVKSYKAESASDLELSFSNSRVEPTVGAEGAASKSNGRNDIFGSDENHASQPQTLCASSDDIIPLPPSIELNAGSEVKISDIQTNLKCLYDYNVILRDKLIATQSLLHSLTVNDIPPVRSTK